jgi:hypothetical protein
MKPNKYWRFNVFLGLIVLILSLGLLWLWRFFIIQTFGNNEERNANNELFQTNAEQIKTDAVVVSTGNKIEQNIITRSVSPSSAITSTAESKVDKINTLEILPTRVNLTVPFTSQAPEKNWSEPWQDACEEAAVLMLDAYYKSYQLSPLFSRDEMLKMVNWEEGKGWGLSIEMVKVKELANWYMFSSTKVIENPTIEQIKRFLANNQPVLVVADGKELPNPHYRNGGPAYHALIIRGYDSTQFITNDPGTQFGENYKYKFDDLMNSIHDWNDGNVKSGRKVVMVVE